MKFTLISCLALISMSDVALGQTVPRGECVSLKSVVQEDNVAEEYIFPLSLRAHIVVMVKTEMKSRGEYPYAIDHTFQPRFHEAIAQRQLILGSEATGCLTWNVVNFYDPLQRRQPNE